MENILSFIPVAVAAIILIALVIYVLTLRRVVPTNLVHIVQRSNSTTSYGVQHASKAYYAFPSWMPWIGVVVQILPVSNFDIDLFKYAAYDKDRLPFTVDVKAYFHIEDTNKAAEKVESFQELRMQLTNVVQGSVRSILAQFSLEQIMEERSVFGDKFTEAVNSDLKNWGVSAIKNIELMDIRDAEDSNVIKNIMSKKMSAISMESRVEIANNDKKAQQAEIEAKQAILVTKAESDRISGEALAKSNQAIGIANAESIRMAGIAEQESLSEIARAEKATTEQKMEVLKIETLKKAEISKEQTIIQQNAMKEAAEIKALADKFKTETDAVADLEFRKKQAEGISVIGKSEADVISLKGVAEANTLKEMELAKVIAEKTLVEAIGSNKEYQIYLVDLKRVEAEKEIGLEQARSMGTALATAELKLLVNSGDVNSGLNKLSDIFSSKGASQINGLLEGLKQTEEGKNLLSLIPGVNKE